MGLDSIIDLNNIKPRYIIEEYIESKVHETLGYFLPSDKTIHISITTLKNYYISSAGEFEAYSTVFHELIHYLRWQIYESVNKSYDKAIKDRFTEELVTEAINTVLLSKKFGKVLEGIVKDIVEFDWKKLTSRYLGDKSICYIYYGDEIILPYALGKILGGILLYLDEHKQKEYIVKLLKTRTKEDLKNLLTDLGKNLPNNYEISNYYNLIDDIIREKAKILYKEKDYKDDE